MWLNDGADLRKRHTRHIYTLKWTMGFGRNPADRIFCFWKFSIAGFLLLSGICAILCYGDEVF